MISIVCNYVYLLHITQNIHFIKLISIFEAVISKVHVLSSQSRLNTCIHESRYTHTWLPLLIIGKEASPKIRPKIFIWYTITGAMLFFLAFSFVFSITLPIISANRTELHVAVQSYSSSDGDLTKFWTRYIVDQINQLELIKNHIIKVDYLHEPFMVSIKPECE